MNIDEAAKILRRAYCQAPKGKKTTGLHLFGIKYADELSEVDLNQLIKKAGIRDSYYTEIRKGIRLSEYVNLKDLPLWFGND